MPNQYTAEDELGPYAGPDMSYAVPTLEDSPYIDVLGWAPSLKITATETPDSQRLQRTPNRTFAPDPDKPPNRGFFGRRARDVMERHSVEEQDADGWEELKGGSGRKAAPNPRAIPPDETRPTQQLAPRSYNFWRPFDVGIARQNNGVHFSMADHRRDYEILGMAPVKQRRNTFRLEPDPWDRDLVDMPPEVNHPTAGPYRAVDIPATATRTWRL